ncbi:MAG TPA: cobalamin-binding protein [Steroidobacteraceae bacterium]|nr:cobalamin-binding protein [Steroidobacteraceae bacterium]
MPISRPFPFLFPRCRRAGRAAPTASALVLALALAPCPRAAALQLTDDTGQELSLPAPAARIVALSPGITAMLFAAGAGARIVATVEYADEPAAARRLPRIGDSTAVDLERLLALHPDVVVAWPGGNSAAQLARIAALGIPLYRQRLNHLDDIPPALERLGRLAGTPGPADAAAAAAAARISDLRRRYARLMPVRVLLETWDQPLYTIGGPQLMSDALGVCGARNIFADLPELSPAVQVEAVLERNPEAIVAAAPPGAGMSWLAPWRRWPQLTAVRDGNLLAFEDQGLSRMGPGIIDATASLCALLDGARERLRHGDRAARARLPGAR